VSKRVSVRPSNNTMPTRTGSNTRASRSDTLASCTEDHHSRVGNGASQNRHAGAEVDMHVWDGVIRAPSVGERDGWMADALQQDRQSVASVRMRGQEEASAAVVGGRKHVRPGHDTDVGAVGRHSVARESGWIEEKDARAHDVHVHTHRQGVMQKSEGDKNMRHGHDTRVREGEAQSGAHGWSGVMDAGYEGERDAWMASAVAAPSALASNSANAAKDKVGTHA
jgi:hypothetical protein